MIATSDKFSMRDGSAGTDRDVVECLSAIAIKGRISEKWETLKVALPYAGPGVLAPHKLISPSVSSRR